MYVCATCNVTGMALFYTNDGCPQAYTGRCMDIPTKYHHGVNSLTYWQLGYYDGRRVDRIGLGLVMGFTVTVCAERLARKHVTI